jgi:hypothetical protein
MPYKKNIQPFQTSSAVETRQFLTTHSVTDDELMRELWNVSSGLPGLLDARRPSSAPSPLLRRGEKDFIYDPAKSKYIRALTKRPVSEREIRNAIFKVSNEAKNRVSQATKQMMAGTILFVIWYQRLRSILKALYRAVWIVTLGGVLFEDDSARNAFYLWIILMFDRLNEMKIGIETGTIIFNGHIVSAVGRLARSANALFQNAKVRQGKNKGHDQARRVLGENENHCHDSEDRQGCIELAALGWVEIDSFVPIGLGTCRDNCLCQAETRKRTNE